MDYSNFLMLREELSLLVVIILLFLFDTFGSAKSLRYFSGTACVLLTAHIIYTFIPADNGSAFGGMYYGSPIMSVVKTVLSIGTLLVFLQSNHWLNHTDNVIRRGEFYILTLSTLFGMYLMVSAGNFLLFYIGLETASLPIAALVAFEKYKQNSYEAAAKYIFTAVFSSAIMLFGLSFIYGTTGSFYFENISADIVNNPLQIMAMIFFFSGVGFKISLVPFHLWTADVYQGAPTQVTSYLSVISKAAASFALMVILFKVFGGMVEIWQNILYGIIIVTITVANLFAIRQKNLKRFLAFSSISQAGYVMLGIIAGSVLGMTSAVYYLLIYVFSNLAAFGVISVIENKTGKVDMDDYNGLYQTNPKLSLTMMLAMFSLAGIPPFAGFFSKFFIFASAAREGFYVLVFIALVNTIIALYYYLLVVKAMFINKNETPIATLKSDGSSKLSLSICVAAILAVGIISMIYDKISLLSFGI
ncbi:MAG: NADH-quinone oxidoreductase subunit N [Bacteroidaceae bacterium]|nr:NADH-quinone oxidoreductase subunit N [Bacteroidaceae bacterium]